MSPTIFRDGSFRFYFFSREESRMHVHVQGPDGEAKFWLEPSIALAQNYGLSEQQSEALRFWSKDTPMKSAAHGASTLVVEVTNISTHGFWLLLGEEELFLPFEKFPWFRDATVRQIMQVELPSAHHLYWPGLDIDLAVESIRYPEKFPLVSGVSV